MRSLAHLAIIAIACTNGSTRASDTGVRTWDHVKILAADGMEGRRTGSPGHRRAAEYVATQFRRAGLDPGGSAGFLERVDLVERRIDEARSSLTLVQDGEIRPLTLGEDAIFNLRGKPAPALEAPLVFAGYGLRIPSHGVDDLQGLDLKGKVVVAFLAAPTDVPGAVQAHFGSPGERWKTYRAAGAVGVAFIPNPFSMDLPWKRVALTRLEPYMALADPSFDEFRGQDVWVTVNPARAETFFEGSATSYAALLALLKDGKALPRFDLRGKLRALVAASSVPISSDNVVAILRGSDRSLRGESVVVSAHLDHLGIGSSGGEDRIFNGAMDNAAGVAVLIETAARLNAERRRGRRSIVFLAVTGEEMGHLGSRAYARRASADRMRPVANVNSDMFLPLFPLKHLIVFGLDESDLGADVRAVAAPMHIEVQADPEPLRNRFIRSDQYSFVRLGIPAVALKTGFEIDSPEQAIERRWFAERYHALSDEIDQPVDYAAIAQYTDLMTTVVLRIADRETAPTWSRSSFFATLATPSKRQAHE